MNAARLIDRVDRVRPMGPGRWLARCPAHEDRSPSLSIRELDDGRLLIHDFGGCATSDVLASLGLDLQDLYPERLGHHLPPSHSRIPARDLLVLINEEALTVGFIAAEFLEQRVIDKASWERLAQAVARIGTAAAHAR
jgi:hypothetical protein